MAPRLLKIKAYPDHGVQTPSGLAPASLSNNISHCSPLAFGAPGKSNKVHLFEYILLFLSLSYSYLFLSSFSISFPTAMSLPPASYHIFKVTS